MVTGGTVTCNHCQSRIWLKWQIGYADKSTVRICCPGCKLVLRGSLDKGKQPFFAFENASYSEEIDPGDPIIAISSEFPIVKDLVQKKGPSGYALTPFLAFSEKLDHTTQEQAHKNYSSFSESWKKQGDAYRDLINFFIRGDYTNVHSIVKKRFIPALDSAMTKDFITSAHLANQVLSPVFKQTVAGSYKPYYFERLLVKKTLSPIENDLARLKTVASNVGKIVDIEKEFSQALQLLLRFLDTLESFLPVILLGHAFRYDSKFKDEYQITTFDYDDLKGFYVDFFELMSRFSTVYVGFYAYAIRNNIDDLADFKGANSLKTYWELNHGLKIPVIMSNPDISKYFRFILDNKLRNGIGHYKTHYDAENQILKYFPYKGNKAQKSETISLTDFAFQIYLAYLATTDFVNFIGRVNNKLI